MSETTPSLALPLLAAAQAQKHVTHNEALLLLDAAVQLAVLDRTRATPPPTPVLGDRHIVAAGAGGDWAGRAGAVAVHDGSGWRFLTPRAGWRAHVVAEGRSVGFDGTAWRDALAFSPSGAGVGLRVEEIEVDLAGAAVTTALVIPDRAICLGVASRVLVALAGTAGWSLGIAGEASKFGTGLATGVGATTIGAIGAQAFYADTPVVVSAGGGTFTGGRVRLALTTLVLAAPGGPAPELPEGRVLLAGRVSEGVSPLAGRMPDLSHSPLSGKTS
ncbi:DUF2793 domain-containing protein [Ancylobacter oerskovii]|uniref:DUF2793 domain-containing protein n=1 Tax=Ancylobacter oerskovii TaxID=459519 RepID=A0ABW4YY27_9HYPH|nr:DUF2793 domain-containing protein [Ancylobacter oerskovii]MBS7541996.1 DUF2793 domain-containing protein [Ancylobacter oerskovii]